MLVKKEDMPVTQVNIRNGIGMVDKQIVVPADKLVNSRLFAKFTVPSGHSMGMHDHVKEVEYYYILSGEGVVTEPAGEYVAKEGDCVITGWGDSHAIRNEKDVPLEFIAVINLE